MKHNRTLSCYGNLLFTLTLLVLFAANLYSQTPSKWNINGNTIASGEYIGTNNNEDFIIKANNNVAVKIKANGNFILKSLESSGTGLVTFDNNGKLGMLNYTGDATRVLLADGSWGVLPLGSQWENNGTKIYYNGGKVGIGTSTPNYKLDVDGDVRITQNLYLQGALVINEKITTPKQMKAASIVTDSIIMDSTKAFYGVSKFTDPVKLQSKLSVNGDADFLGALIARQGVKFDNLNGISYSNISGVRTFSYGRTGLTYRTPACAAQASSTANIFGGILQIYDADATGGITPGSGLLNLQAWTGGSSIDASIEGNTGPGSLLLNYFCGNNTYINTGTNGGDVQICSATLGKVGIGSSSPTEKLDVLGNIKVNGYQIYFKDQNHGIGYFDIYTTTGKYANKSIDGPVLYGYTGGALGTNQSGTKNIALSWLANGDVGIGIDLNGNNPNGYKLAVNGTIGAKEMKVEISTTPWPDYVFEKEYKLTKITELEKYLQINKHLPGIPSSEDVSDAGGVLIGDFQTKLLQKVEELTLYIIEQNKRIEALENK
ncbi:MAG: calcium-binding protein [Bacteroidetes bacterium]|nr:calcium-binding protein [Bacteroidota bacterium]